MTIRILSFIALFGSLQAFAQQSDAPAHQTLGLYQAMQHRSADFVLPLLVQGNIQQIQSFIIAHHGMVKYVSGDIVSATLDISSIKMLIVQPFVVLADCPTGKLTLMNDVMVAQNNIDSAYNGNWPLDQSFDGTGVVIGIIDAPFDINHGDFKDAAGNTRIKYIWDQNITGTPPVDFGYGTECDSAMIANGTCVCVDDNPLGYSHGSGVAGVAASSGHAAERYRGVAPGADLIFVAADLGDNFMMAVPDAIAYIYAKADELGKPCVINTSLGVYSGSHDGSDLASQTIDGLISAHSGRSLVAAAGNAGNNAFHLGYDVSATEQFTWFKKLSYLNLVYYELWADSTDLDGINFRIIADDPAGFITIGSTPAYNMLSDFAFAGGTIDSTDYVISGGGDVKIYAEKQGSKYFLQFVITPDNPSYYWRFATSGSGYFDIWAVEGITGFSNYVTTGLPTAAVMPEIVNYKLPNTDQSIVSSWQCSDKVITVGSYVNRDTMTNYYGDMPSLIDPVGDLFYSSSHGPTRDGRIKPDICATGARILSTGAQVLTDWLISLGAANYMSVDGQHYLYNGTSFASPVVAGIAALYLQKNPGADYAEIKNAILTQAKSDAFTGASLPNNLWGYGKADAFRTLTGPWGCSVDDYLNPPMHPEVLNLLPTKANIGWDLIPNATGYKVSYKTGAGPTLKANAYTNSKILNGLAPNTTYSAHIRAFCNVYGLSNWSSTLTFTTLPLRETNVENEMVSVYPNPATDEIHISGCGESALVTIFDLMGKRVLSEIINDENASIALNKLQDGIYQLIIEESDFRSSIKIIVAR